MRGGGLGALRGGHWDRRPSPPPNPLCPSTPGGGAGAWPAGHDRRPGHGRRFFEFLFRIFFWSPFLRYHIFPLPRLSISTTQIA